MHETEYATYEELVQKHKKLRGETKALSDPSIISSQKNMLHVDFDPMTYSENVPDSAGIIKQRCNQNY